MADDYSLRHIRDHLSPTQHCSDMPSHETRLLAVLGSNGALSPIDYASIAIDIHGAYDWRTRGDFYKEPDDVVRSLPRASLDCEDAYVPCLERYRKCDALPASRAVEIDTSMTPEAKLNDLMPASLVEEIERRKIEAQKLVDEALFFCIGDEALAAPPHVLGDGLGATTCIWFPNVLPPDAGNQLVAVLRSQRGVQITKLRPKKLSMNVAAYVDGGSFCHLKIFVYKVITNGEGSVAEFQRRRGDGIAFHHLLNHVRGQLEPSVNAFNAQTAIDSGPEHTPYRIPCSKIDEAATLLTPLLHMILYAKSDDQKAEAVGALQAAVGGDTDIAAAICTPELCAALTSLLSADAFCVVYPTARLIATFALCASAARLFTDGVVPLIRLIIAKIEEQMTIGAAATDELVVALRRLARLRRAENAFET